MRCRELICTLVLLPLLTASLAAAPPPENLLQRANWVRPEICDGRLVVQNLRAGQARIAQKPENEDLPRQMLALECDDVRITLRYEAEDERGAWNLTVTNEREVTLQRLTFGDEPGEITFRQPLEGDVKLNIRDQHGSHEYAARSLWRLLLGGDSRCREQTVALLEGLWPRLNLATRISEARQALLQMATGSQTTQEDRWTRWIEQLGDESYAVRQAADRRLRDAGRPAAVFLGRLNLAELDAESRLRIRRILADAADDSGDTPQRIALLVEDDSLVWLRLLESTDAAHRAQAREKLMSLTQRPVEFDPAADVKVREQQTQTIREQLTRAE